MLASITRNWWMVLVRGLCAVVFGILAFAWPGITLASLIIVYGVYVIVDGMTAIVVGIAGGADGAPWWQMILVGFASLIAGLVTFLWPGITALVLLAIIAAWSIIRGITEIVVAIQLRALVENEWMLILSGVCSVIFGVLLIVRPGAGALALLWIIGTYAIAIGVLTIVLALRLRSLNTAAGQSGAFAASSN